MPDVSASPVCAECGDTGRVWRGPGTMDGMVACAACTPDDARSRAVTFADTCCGKCDGPCYVDLVLGN